MLDIMAKRSQSCSLRQERNQAGCVRGLINIFDFRNVPSTKRLLLDRRLALGAGNSSNQTIIPSQTDKSRVDVESRKMPTAHVARTSVKELMEEEMINEQSSENQPNGSETSLKQSHSDHRSHPKNHQKKKNRSQIKSVDVDVSELDASERLITENSNQAHKQGASDNLDLEQIMEELAEISQIDDLDISSDQAVRVVEEKLVAAVKMFTEQRLSCSKRCGEEGYYCCSEEIMDALQTLSSNKGVFLKLVQDPNSKLVKLVRDLQDADLRREQMSNLSDEKSVNVKVDEYIERKRNFFRRRSRSMERYPVGGEKDLESMNKIFILEQGPMRVEKPVNVKVDESSGRKQRNFFRRSKSMGSYPVGGEKDLESTNKIVVLKPFPTGVRSPGSNSMVNSLAWQSRNVDYKVHNERNPSLFSFTEIKRKLRHAMGREKQGVSLNRLTLKHQNGNNADKGSMGENFGWCSSNRNPKYTERFFISSPSFKNDEKLKDVNETSQNRSFGGSNIYIEAKKHLSEMVKNGDENPESTKGQLPKSLGRILSLPEYNISPSCSPRKFGDDIFTTAQKRLSTRSNVKNNMSSLLQENLSNCPNPRWPNLLSQPDISEDKVQSLDTSGNIPLSDDQEYSSEIQSFGQDAIVPEVQRSPSIVGEIEEMTESRPWEEKKIISGSSEESNNLICGDIEIEVTREVDVAEESSPCFKLPLFGEDQTLSSPAASPSRCPVNPEVEDSDCAIDKMERPSPISVLDPFFTDDDVSPSRTRCQPVEKEIQPLLIHFEEQLSTNDQGICTRISLEDEESAFEYVEAVLLGSGLNWDEFLLRWICMNRILDRSLFNEVELFSSRPRHDQKLLFDSTNDALQVVCETYFAYFLGISHVKLNIQTPPKGMDLIQEVWQQVEHLLVCHPCLHSLDQLVETDLERSRKWMYLQSDIEFIVFEMEETIFVELVEEIVLSFADDILESEFSVLHLNPIQISDHM